MPRAVVQLQESVINRPGLMTLPAAIHYGRGAIDQFKVWEFEMYFLVDAGFAVPYAAWNAAVAIAKDTLLSSGRWACKLSTCALLSPSHIACREQPA